MERRDPAAHNSFVNKEGRGEMTKTPVDLQDLRRRIYVKAKAEPSRRFWGLYVHVCKTETLNEAYRLAKENNGAPGIDGVTFEAIEALGVEQFVEQLRKQLSDRAYRPLRARMRGWVNHFSVGHSSRCMSFIRNWVEKKMRRHLAQARLRQGFGWKRWSRRWLYETTGLFDDYRVRYLVSPPKVAPAGRSHNP